MNEQETKRVRSEERAAFPEGARRATGGDAAATNDSDPLIEGQRWSRNRKKEVVLRLLRGESLDALSRELAVEIYRLEEWREQALAGLDAGLRAQKTDPTELRLAEAHKRLGEALMENELLRERCRRQGIPLPLGMSKR
jgi:transposase